MDGSQETSTTRVPNENTQDQAQGQGETRGFALQLDLDMFSGPLDVLLELARQGKTDLTRLSMSRLAEQYLGFIQGLEQRHQDIASEYLVMACVLVWMKSRMLLPQLEEEKDVDSLINPEYMALRLRHLQCLKGNMRLLEQRPRLGEDYFLRGNTGIDNDLSFQPRMVPVVSLRALYQSYASLMARHERPSLSVHAPHSYTVEAALDHIRSMLLGGDPSKGWSDWMRLLPAQYSATTSYRRSIMACIFVASLELTRLGYLELDQTRAYGGLRVRARKPVTDDHKHSNVIKAAVLQNA